MSEDKKDPEPNKPPLKMQIRGRTIEEELPTYYAECSAPEPEFKAAKKKV